MRAYCLALMMAATILPAAANAAPANVKASVAATAARTEANVKLDASRKPAEVLTFLGLKKLNLKNTAALVNFINVHGL